MQYQIGTPISMHRMYLKKSFLWVKNEKKFPRLMVEFSLTVLKIPLSATLMRSTKSTNPKHPPMM